MKTFLLYLLLMIFLIGCVSSMNKHKTTLISEDDARSIAELKIKELGWKITIEEVVDIYWSITPWDKRYPDDKEYYNTLPYYSEFNRKLKGKKYWSVHYHPKIKSIHGGEFCFFIDAETGDIIDIYRGS